jgi:hypothetical protein
VENARSSTGPSFEVAGSTPMRRMRDYVRGRRSDRVFGNPLGIKRPVRAGSDLTTQAMDLT